MIDSLSFQMLAPRAEAKFWGSIGILNFFPYL